MTSRLSADLRFACRSIWRRPAFSAVVIVTLGLGIAANTAMFGVVHATLIRPLPYEEPERLVLGRCTFASSAESVGPESMILRSSSL